MSEVKFDDKAAEEKGNDLACRYSKKAGTPYLIFVQTNSFVDGALWQFSQSQAAYDKLREDRDAHEKEMERLLDVVIEKDQRIAELEKALNQVKVEVNEGGQNDELILDIVKEALCGSSRV